MSYQVLDSLKVRTPEGIRELQAGEVVDLPQDIALRLTERGKVKPFSPDCFSPDGILEAAIKEAIEDGWIDNQMMEYVDALKKAGCLKAPWGFKVKDSLLMGDYWIISDTTAREKIPMGVMSFTLDELRPIVEAPRVFKGAKVVKVDRHKGKGVVNA